MKKLLIGIGAVLAVALLVWAVVAVKSNLYEREITAYAGTAIVAIASNWDEQALLQRASPELLATTNEQEIANTFVTYRRLGRMLSLSKGMGRLQVVYSTAGEKLIVAVYIARAQFERRSVAIKLTLIKHNTGWQIMGFDIMPDRPPDDGTVKTAPSLAPFFTLRKNQDLDPVTEAKLACSQLSARNRWSSHGNLVYSQIGYASRCNSARGSRQSVT